MLDKTGKASEIARLFGSTFSRVEIGEGRYELISIQVSANGQPKYSRFPVNVERNHLNHLYFVSLDPDYGFKNSDTERAKEIVCLCQMVKGGSLEGYGTVLYTHVPPPPRPYLAYSSQKEGGPTFYLQQAR